MAMELVDVEAGMDLIKQGGQAESFYLVKEGTCAGDRIHFLGQGCGAPYDPVVLWSFAI